MHAIGSLEAAAVHAGIHAPRASDTRCIGIASIARARVHALKRVRGPCVSGTCMIQTGVALRCFAASSRGLLCVALFSMRSRSPVCSTRNGCMQRIQTCWNIGDPLLGFGRNQCIALWYERCLEGLVGGAKLCKAVTLRKTCAFQGLDLKVLSLTKQ